MAELALSIVGAIDLCFKYGKLLVDTYDSFKAAESELGEHVVRLQSIWLRTSSQLDFLRQVWSTLDESHQRVQHEIVQRLAGKLQLANSKIAKVVKKDADTDAHGSANVKVLRWKYALLKEGIEKTLNELELWQRIFDPSWFLIMRISNPQIDRGLDTGSGSTQPAALRPATALRTAVRPPTEDKTRVFLPTEGLELDRNLPIPFSAFAAVQRKGSSRWLLFETVHAQAQVDAAAYTRNVRDIARRLSHVNPFDFRLLSCPGVIKRHEGGSPQPTSFTFVFRFPDGYAQPRGLRGVLSEHDLFHSLSERFRIARDLVTAVSSVHSFGLVHKNIRPESIVLFARDQESIGHPFLAGFEAFRAADTRTARLGDSEWYLNLYRHPRRQGLTPQEDYIMQHDIYSLGVCLLEVGLFESFVKIDSNGHNAEPTALLGFSLEEISFASGEKIKQRLLALAQERLPVVMGTKYSNIVVTCLTCLDEDNIDFGDEREFQDEDGIQVNVRYIEKVLVQLNEISV